MPLQIFCAELNYPPWMKSKRELTQAAAAVRANQQALDRRDRAIIAAAKAGYEAGANRGARRRHNSPRVSKLLHDQALSDPKAGPKGSRDTRPRQRKRPTNGALDKLVETSN